MITDKEMKAVMETRNNNDWKLQLSGIYNAVMAVLLIISLILTVINLAYLKQANENLEQARENLSQITSTVSPETAAKNE